MPTITLSTSEILFLIFFFSILILTLGILGAFALAVKSGFRENLHAVFCLAENAVGPKAQRPDDVVVMYSGKTVEVNNTDAEGRLVLGDGVAFAKKDLKVSLSFLPLAFSYILSVFFFNWRLDITCC